MPRKSYSEMVGEMENAGGYCTDPIGKCLREVNSVRGIPKKDIDICLRDSETYAAYLRRDVLSQRFNQQRPEKAWLEWTENFSQRLRSPKLEVWVDRNSGIFREGTRDRFGYLADVEDCLHYGVHVGGSSSAMKKPRHEVDLTPDIQAELHSCKASYENEPETEREAIIAARLGQGRFRDDLIKLWAGKCAVTKSRVRSLLRASHIKPWRDSTNAERLNQHNGLLLAPNLDAAFDVGLISFADDGKILMSPDLVTEEAKLLGIKCGLKLVCVSDENKSFLAAHRKLHGF